MLKKIIIGSHSTELKKRCGIATFMYNVTQHALNHPRVAGLRINSHTQGPQEYRFDRKPYLWRETDLTDPNLNIDKLLDDIEKDKNYWSKGGMERVELVSHEYGIFRDGKGKDFLVPLLKGCKERGIITVLFPHTILARPDRYGPDYGLIMEEAVQYPDDIICMTPEAIEMLKILYKAPRGNLADIPHGINRIDMVSRRPFLKERYGIDVNTDVFVSGGFFSTGKLIDMAIEALAMSRDWLGGDDNFKYFQIGLEKDDDATRKHKAKCFELAKKKGFNPISIGRGDYEKNGEKYKGLDELLEHDLRPHKVIFFNTFLNDKDSYLSKDMCDATFNVNESDSQISSGEVVRALEAKRVPISFESPISRDMDKRGVGLVAQHGNVYDLAEKINFFRTKADREELEFSATKVGSGLYFDKVVPNIIDRITAIVDKKDENMAESRKKSDDN